MAATDPGSDQLLAEQTLGKTLTAPAAPPKRPDITPVQIISGVPVIATLLSAFGVITLSASEQAALSDALTWALGLVGADAIIRVGRNLAR